LSGNIVLSIEVVNASEISRHDALKLLHQEGPYFEKFLLQMKTSSQKLVRMGSSYGAELFCLCDEVLYAEGWPDFD
jgi:hypothetical protein